MADRATKMSQTQRQHVDSGHGQTPQLPLAMRQELAVVRRCSPRFLLRGFSQSSGGGHMALNTINGVTPHVFLDTSTQKPHASIETFSSFDLNQALKNHLQTRVTAIEFSSWAFAVKMPMYFAKHSNGNLIDSTKKAYLSVIDLQNLDRPLHAYHVPKLRKVFEVAPSGTWLGVGGQYLSEGMENLKWSAKSYEYKHEYLIHGKVQGPGYHVLELDLDTSGTSSLERFLISPNGAATLTTEEVELAIEHARAFGLHHQGDDEIIIFLVTAFISARKQTNTWSKSELDVLHTTLQSVGIMIPASMMREDWIMLDLVEAGGYDECKLTLQMLRALVYRQFGEQRIKHERKLSPVMQSAAPHPKFEELDDN